MSRFCLVWVVRVGSAMPACWPLHLNRSTSLRRTDLLVIDVPRFALRNAATGTTPVRATGLCSGAPIPIYSRSARRHINGSYECTAAIHLGIVGCGYGSYHLGATHGGKLSGIRSEE